MSYRQPIKDKKNSEDFIDWRIELARIPPMVAIIIVHMLLNAEYITPNILSPFDWSLFISLAAFFYISGYVQGLKDEYEEPGSLDKSEYIKHVKDRFLRLYPGYYIALASVFLAQVLAQIFVNKPLIITPWGLFLDLTSLTPILGIFGTEGAVWPIGWFVFAMFTIHLLYPIIRRLISKNNRNFYIIIALSIIFKIFLAIFIPIAAYFFPLSWLAEFTIGIKIGIWSASEPRNSKPTKKFQKLFIKMGKRIWAVYLIHMAPIAFITTGASASILECIIIFIAIIILSELFYRLLRKINRLINKYLK
ncbi:MAG: hypothetical protein EU549_01590 [Promethearchaeota archaeon]|nr:MAG: hypothetical protein EU549_01590 [Candidatus Lokiarchaeota archaeon]